MMRSEKILVVLLAAILCLGLAACGKKTNTATVHKHEYISKVTKDATCAEPGELTYRCYGCGDTYTEVIPVSEQHSYSKTVTKEPTCAEAGEVTYTCSVCGKTYTEETPATGNHMFAYKETVPATCVAEGAMVYKCQTCDEEMSTPIKPTGVHDFETTVTKEATCVAAGERVKKCKNCGLEEKEAIPVNKDNHDYASSVTKEPTCTDAGVRTYTCTRCRNSYTRSIDALGHDWQDWFAKRSLNNGATIIEWRFCTRCDAHEERTIEKPAPSGGQN